MFELGLSEGRQGRDDVAAGLLSRGETQTGAVGGGAPAASPEHGTIQLGGHRGIVAPPRRGREIHREVYVARRVCPIQIREERPGSGEVSSVGSPHHQGPSGKGAHPDLALNNRVPGAVGRRPSKLVE